MALAAVEHTARKQRLLIARKSQQRIFLAALLFSDLIALSLAFVLSYIIRFQIKLPIFDDASPSIDAHFQLALFLIPVWIVVFAFFQLYNIHHLLGGTQEYARTFNASAVVMTLLIVYTFLNPFIRLARGFTALEFILGFVLVTLGRFMLRRIAYRLRRQGWLTLRTLIVGADEEARAIARQLASTPTCGAEILGFVDNSVALGSKVEDGFPVVGKVEDLASLVAWLGVDEIIVSASALPRADWLAIFQTFGHSDQVELRFSPGLFEIFTTGVQVKEIGSVPLVSLNKIRLDPIELAFKTGLEYATAALLLIVFSPVLLLVALLIKLGSPGPIFHRRSVLGRNGRPFHAFKFRTMYVHGDTLLDQQPELKAELQSNHKLKKDPRITPIGVWLRRLSIDELPQLFNVLLGQMSLVGPRMITLEEAERYGKWKWNLLTVKPGITGLWQIKGRSDLSYEERVRLDMYYIRNYTVWLDLQIIWQTLPAIVRGNGAY